MMNEYNPDYTTRPSEVLQEMIDAGHVAADAITEMGSVHYWLNRMRQFEDFVLDRVLCPGCEAMYSINQVMEMHSERGMFVCDTCGWENDTNLGRIMTIAERLDLWYVWDSKQRDLVDRTGQRVSRGDARGEYMGK